MHITHLFRSKSLTRSLQAIGALLLVTFAFGAVARGQTITGGWYGGDPTDRSTNPFVVTFLSNNTFFLAHDGIAGDGGMPGMEFGTYTWNSSTGEFAVFTGEGSHTTGSWGFGSLEGVTTLNFSGNTLSLLPEGETEPMVLNPVASSSSLLVGSFISEDGATVVTFLDSGHYYIAEFGVSADGGQTGMEHGIYNYASGVLSGSVIHETNGSWGFGEGGAFGGYGIADLSASGFTFIDGADQVAFTRIGATAVPEPSTYALMFGAAALGVAVWRRKAART